MRLSAAILLASKSIWREQTTNHAHIPSRKFVFALLATVSVTGSFFCFKEARAEETPPSFISQYFNILPAQAQSSFSLFPASHAKEKDKLDEKGPKDDRFEKKLCQQASTKISLAYPKVEALKKEQLCQTFAASAASTPSPGIAIDPKLQLQEESFKQEVRKILSKTPMNAMIDPISQRDKTVAAFLVGISLKESGLGKHAPHKNGRDCYNYWGYKGNINPTKGGYSCFSSPEQAVEVVGNRIQNLVGKKIDTPSEMVVWKCGSSCKGHSKESVASWIKDVSIHFNKLSNS